MLEDSSKKVRQIGVLGALLWGLFAFIAPSFLMIAALPFVNKLNINDNLKNFIAAAIYEILLIAFVTLILKFYKMDFKAIGLGELKLAQLGTAAAAFAVYLPLSIMLLAVVSQLVPINVDEAQDVGFANLAGIEVPLTFLVLVILTPIAEELLFRGVIFTGFRNKMPFWLAAILVSLLFALAHWQPNVAIDVFAMSLISCYIREKSGSLWPSIYLHVFKNALAFILLFVVKVN